MIRSLVILTAITGFLVAADPTGTDPGQVLPGPFNAYVVFGGPKGTSTEPVQTEERQNYADPSRVGKFHDLITRYGLDPTVAVFTREGAPAEDSPLGKLIKQLDAAVQKNRNARLHAFTVFLGLKNDFLKDDTRIPQIKAIEQLATKLDLKETPLALDQSESDRTKAYNIPNDDQVVIIFYDNLKVRAKLVFTNDKPLDEAGLAAVEAEIKKMLKK
jgi:hypothetical protein